MTHPRAQLKRDIRDLLADIGPPVHVSHARDVNPGEKESITVYVIQEALNRSLGTGEMRAGLPLIRTMTVEILVFTRASGNGPEAAERGDELSRAVEQTLNNSTPDLIPVSTTQSFLGGEQIGCETILTYTVEHFDPMNSEA